jgi:hypothetical protein
MPLDGCLTKKGEAIGRWGGIWQRWKNTTIIHYIVPLVIHKFSPEYTQGKKLGNAVAWTSAAPMQLHCLICYAGIRTLLTWRNQLGYQPTPD